MTDLNNDTLRELAEMSDFKISALIRAIVRLFKVTITIRPNFLLSVTCHVIRLHPKIKNYISNMSCAHSCQTGSVNSRPSIRLITVGCEK